MYKLIKPLGIVLGLTMLFVVMLSVSIAAPLGKSSIGDYVWRDSNANGIQDPSEVGINGVTVNLYKDGANSNPKDGIMQPTELISSTLTTTNPDSPFNLGWYDFKVDGGETYFVEIPASNFASGGPLHNFVLTSEGTIDSNPTFPITLALQEDYNDADFGFARAAIDIVKVAVGTPDNQIKYIVSPGSSVTYSYTVRNTGEVPLSVSKVAGAGVADDKCANPSYVSGDTSIQGILAPGGTEAWIFTCTANITVDTTNIGTATGTATDNTGTPLPQVDSITTPLVVQDTDNAIVDVVAPAIDIQKTVYLGHNNGASCPGVERVAGKIGDAVTYCFRITNTGDTHLQATVSDATIGMTSVNLGLLAPGGVATHYYQSTINGDLVNTATATGNPTTSGGVDLPGVNDVTDTDTAQVTYLRAAIGDYVWYDRDGDAYQDVDEIGIGNVTVDLYRNVSGNWVFVETTTTDRDGGYLFNNLQPGIYRVDVTDTNSILTGLNRTTGAQSQTDPTPAITVASGDIYRDADFGYVAPSNGNAIIGDTVWYDHDADGVQDPGEPGIPGIIVCATPVGGGTAICDVTDVNGNYLLTVPPGNYTVAPSNPPGGYTVTTPASQTVTLVANQTYLDADFGYDSNTLLGTIGNQVWHDTTKDGTFASEPGIPGVSVDLIRDTNNNGIWEVGEPIIATTTTNQNGQYLFQGVPAGNYLVLVSDTQNVLDDYEPTTVIGGTSDNTNKAQPYRIQNFPAGGNNLTADFGYVLLPAQNTGIVGNQVWYETDVDGLYEPGNGETGIAGVTVELLNNLGQVITSTTTGASGDYVFTSLAAGTYSVRVANNASNTAILGNYQLTTIVGGTADNTNKAQPYSAPLATSSSTNMTADFGYTSSSTLGDFVWWDIDKDGIQDSGEPGIPGVVVILYRDNDNSGTWSAGDTQIASTTTNASGLYEFEVTGAAANYIIKIDPTEFASGGTLQNWSPSPANVGGNDAVDSDGNAQSEIATNLSVGEVDTTNDFGFTINSNFVITKKLNTPEPVRTGDPISFTIRITNTGNTHLATIPLADTYSITYLTYINANPASVNNADDGIINWTDVTGAGQLAPGASIAVVVNFLAFGDTTAIDPAQSPCTAVGSTCNVGTAAGVVADPDGPSGPLGAQETLPTRSGSDDVAIINPTSVALASYSVESYESDVVLRWETINEADLLGFNIYRQRYDGTRQKLNETLISATNAGQSIGAVYMQQISGQALTESYSFILEFVMVGERTSTQNLGQAGNFRIFLPATQR